MTYENAIEAADYIRSRFNIQIETAVVLGSGLGAFGDELENAVRIPYETIPHFARSTVEGHAGQLVLGEIGGVTVAVQQGRFHYYEGYEMPQVIFPMRVFARLGAKNVILTNAAGSLRTSFKPGSLVLIRDHINMMGVNALRGPNDPRFGPRFPDMTAVYDQRLQSIAYDEANNIAAERGIAKFLYRGVYCALSGPTYETPSEIKVFRMLGADLVGMSTVPEAVAARHSGMRVLGISCVTNLGAGLSGGIIHHEEVMETGARVAEIFKELLRRTIIKISEL